MQRDGGGGGAGEEVANAVDGEVGGAPLAVVAAPCVTVVVSEEDCVTELELVSEDPQPARTAARNTTTTTYRTPSPLDRSSGPEHSLPEWGAARRLSLEHLR